MTYIQTISPVTESPAGDDMLANYARCVITAAALLNAHRAMGHRMASFHVAFANDMNDALHRARREAETAAPPARTMTQVHDDIQQQAFLLLTQDIAQYHDRITY